MRNPVTSVVALYREAFAGLPRLTWLLCLAGFLNRCGSMVVPFLGLYVKDRWRYDPDEAGFVVALYGIGALCGSWLGGWLADRIGPVRVQVVTLLSSGAWMLAMTRIDDARGFAAAVLLLGVLNDAFRPGSITAVAISCAPELRRKALTLNRLMLNLGWSFGPTIGGYLTTIDFHWMFLADGGTCALAAGFLFVALRHWRPEAPARRRGDSWRPFQDRHFLWLMLTNVVVITAFMQYFTTGTRVFEDGGYSKQTIGWFVAINPIMITLFEMPVVHALQRRPALPLVALGAAVIGLGFACFLLPFGGATIVLGMVVIAVGELLQMPTLGAYVNDHAPAGARGAYNGAYGMSFTLALVLAPLLGGLVYQGAGAATLWCACTLAGLMAAAGFRRATRG
ncbi:MAG: MFS transporter [Planctomycetes bacterium]|nr:MFS transporter [Planctomycetota bacterium]